MAAADTWWILCACEWGKPPAGGVHSPHRYMSPLRMALWHATTDACTVIWPSSPKPGPTFLLVRTCSHLRWGGFSKSLAYLCTPCCPPCPTIQLCCARPRRRTPSTYLPILVLCCPAAPPPLPPVGAGPSPEYPQHDPECASHLRTEGPAGDTVAMLLDAFHTWCILGAYRAAIMAPLMQPHDLKHPVLQCEPQGRCHA